MWIDVRIAEMLTWRIIKFQTKMKATKKKQKKTKQNKSIKSSLDFDLTDRLANRRWLGRFAVLRDVLFVLTDAVVVMCVRVRVCVCVSFVRIILVTNIVLAIIG
jgi:hypothetical protein